MLARAAGRLVALACALLLIVTVLTPDAHARIAINDQPSRASLVPEQTTLEPGSTLWLALDIELAPGWHTYWINPGDSGFPVAMDWTLPPGFDVGEPLYPVPEVHPYGPLINYGYGDRATILWPIQVPDDLELGRDYGIAAAAEYLVCSEICIPANAEFDLQIPYKGSAPLVDSSMAAFFDESRGKLPREFPASAEIVASDQAGQLDLALKIPPFVDGLAQLTDWYFFPRAETLLDHGMPQRVMDDPAGKGLLLNLPLRDRDAALPTKLSGILVATDSSSGEPIRLGFDLDVPVVHGTLPADQLNDSFAVQDDAVSMAFLLAMAFLGGLLLNLMPCVFPVLSLKLFSLMRHAESGDLKHQRRQGWLYGAGIITSMLVLGGAVLAFRHAGMSIGWGFQLQEPILIGALACLFFTLGFVMLGLLPIPHLFMSAGGKWAGRQDDLGSFMTGVLAVVAASPCTAPFMATAVGAALLLNAPIALAIFASLGLGMALPLMLVAIVPVLARHLPKPGNWMIKLQQFLAFPLFATTIWLVFVLSEQRGSLGVALLLSILLLISLAIWVPRGHGLSRALAVLLGIALPIAGLVSLDRLPVPAQGADAGAQQFADQAAYSPERLQAALADDRNVFINATAAWCITCLVNKQVALDNPDVIAAFNAADVLYLEADWTNRDPVVTELLEGFNRLGLPLYVVYQAGSDEPTLLPQILLPGMLVDLYAPERKVQQASLPD